MGIVGGVLQFLDEFGVNPRKTISSLRGFPLFVRDWLIFKSKFKRNGGVRVVSTFYPCLGDRFANGGTAKGHYFYQDLLVATKVFNSNPAVHVDIGSRVDGFVAHVATFRKIEVIDIRPLVTDAENIEFIEADVMSEKFGLVNYCDSLSSLHALEHFGLGRYGDPVNPDGHIFGLSKMHGMLKENGRFYLSVPIGPQRVEFNAHRVFSLSYLLALFENRFRVDNFSFVDDQGDLHRDMPLCDKDVQNNYGCKFGCGIFEMTKI